MEDTFRSFLWFGVALALVIFGTVLMLGSVSIGEFAYGQESKLTEQLSDQEKLARESEHRVERRTNDLERLHKSNAKLEKTYKARLAAVEQHEALQNGIAEAKENIAEATVKRETLLEKYEQKRKEVMQGVLGNTVEEFTTSDGRSFKNVEIIRDDGERVSFRSEFGGRAFKYEELSAEMQKLMAISSPVEEIKDRLVKEPEAVSRPKVVNRSQTDTNDELSAHKSRIQNQLTEARQRYAQMQRMIPHLRNQADRLESEERSKRIKSADVRNKISQMRQEAGKMAVEMQVLQQEIIDLSRQLNSD